jgi:hypothetical protein
MPPFLKRLKRTFIFDPRAVSTIFSATNIALPPKEGIKKMDHLIRARDELPLLDGVHANEPTKPMRKYL